MAARKGCHRCLRVCLLISSILFLIIGDVIVGAGIYFALYDGQPVVQELSRALPREFFVFRAGLIAFGSVIVLVSFCACVGLVLRSRCALVLYSILTCLLALGCTAAAVVLVALPSVRLAALSQTELTLKRSYGNASLVTYAVDSVQAKLKCCGWQQEAGGSSSGTQAAPLASGCDWFADTAWHRRNDCPPSCCPSESSPSCTKDGAHKSSCSATLGKYLIAVPLVLVAAVILSFSHLICVLILMARQSRELISAV